MSEDLQRTQAWHEARRNRITASIVGAILGNAPYMTREQAMRSLVRDSLGEPSEFKTGPHIEWGVANEDTAVMDFEMDTGLTVTKAFFDTKEDWAGCSADGYVSDGGGLEAKCPYGIRKAPSPVPFKSLDEQPHYHDQIQFSLWVTDRPNWHFTQWAINGNKHVVVQPSQEWRDTNLPILRQFYAEFIHERDNNADFYRAPLRKEIDTPEAHRALKEWDEIKEAMDNLKERQADLLAEIVGMAGDVDALIAGRKLTKVVKDGAVSYAKALKELCPDADLEKWRGKSSSFWKLT